VIATFAGKTPHVPASAFVVGSAVVVGDVTLGEQASLWFHAVVRGDIFPIRIGARSNVQDNATVHVVGGRLGTTIGCDVTVGHGAIVHGCTIGDRTLIGMGAIVLDGAVVGDDCLIGAGALVTPGTRIADGMLVLGSPGRAVRALTSDERAANLASAANYVRYAADYRTAGIT
jgi:carbonic anhydrase/acetyltransferase-like protein (isoleucine patch superfamily)